MKPVLYMLGAAAAVTAGVLAATVIAERRQRRAHLRAHAQRGR